MKKLILVLAAAVLIFSGCDKVVPAAAETKSSKLVFAVFRDNTETFRTVAKNFTDEHPNINIKITELSDDSTDNHRILSSVLAGGEVTMDIIIAEDVWMREFIDSGRLRPLDDYVSVDMSLYPKRFSQVASNGKKLYGIPFELDVGISFYRHDLTDGTMDFKQLAESNGISYTVQGADKEDMICTVRECVNFCGDIQSGLELYKKLVNNSYSSSDSYVSDFKNGKAAYTVSWLSNSKFIGNGFSKINGKIKTIMLSSDQRPYTAAKAYCAAINNRSAAENSEAAKAFLNYLLRDDVQLFIAKNRGTLPLKYKFYDNPMIYDYNEYNIFFNGILDDLDYRPAKADYIRLSDKAQQVIKDYINGDTDLDSAVSAFEKIY